MIENKFAKSGLKTIDLEKFLPKENDLLEFDLKDFLFRGLLLKEKDFRASVKEFDWQQFEGKGVAIFCSTDAIIPMWACMLVASELNEIAAFFVFGTKEELSAAWTRNNIQQQLDIAGLAAERVIVKGCGKRPIPPEAYVEATRLLRPVVKSLMFGEACSTVPVFKRK